MIVIIYFQIQFCKSKIVGDLKIENDTVNFGKVLVGTTVPSFDLTNIGNTSTN